MCCAGGSILFNEALRRMVLPSESKDCYSLAKRDFILIIFTKYVYQYVLDSSYLILF